MARSPPLWRDAVDTSLTIRRAAGVQRQDEARYLADWARFATARGEPQVVAHTAIAWAAHAPSEPQRATRLTAVGRFAHLRQAADRRHARPPQGIVAAPRQRPTPDRFRHEEVQALMRHARPVHPIASLRPQTDWTLIGV